MAGCPECGRPVALARASCLYCGAALGEAAALLAEPAPTAAEDEAPPSLVVVDIERVDPPELADAFSLPAAETAQWVRRGGFRLTSSAATPERAEAEVARLTQLGLSAVALPGSEVAEARAPYEALSVRRHAERLEVRHSDGRLAIAAPDVLLLVTGPIRREYQTTTEKRRFRLATLDQGYRFHLHLHRELRPVELDPHSLEFEGDVPPGSSQLRLSGWLTGLGPDWARDDGFRLVPPALGLEQPTTGPQQLAAALRGGDDGGSQVLDNVTQFRFFSAWQGLTRRALRNA